jgi:hypothetical protein
VCRFDRFDRFVMFQDVSRCWSYGYPMFPHSNQPWISSKLRKYHGWEPDSGWGAWTA